MIFQRAVAAQPEYELVRTRRTSLALHVDSKARLIVRAPLKMSQRQIDRFIVQKKDWIAEKQQHVRAQSEKYKPVVVDSGGSILFLGSNHTLVRDDIAVITKAGPHILLPKNAGKEALIGWLRHQAREVISQKAESYAEKMGVSYTALRISSARSRWGSCSAKNSLSFTWRLVMCPTEIIDYLVVHELSHVTHKNHSRDFWAEVSTFLPDYKERQKWLKDNRALMDVL